MKNFDVVMSNEWWKSKTKRGAVLIGVGTIVVTVGMIDKGDLGLAAGIAAILTEIGVIWTIIGFRNAIDKKK